jgi:hypothetical protein
MGAGSVERYDDLAEATPYLYAACDPVNSTNRLGTGIFTRSRRRSNGTRGSAEIVSHDRAARVSGARAVLSWVGAAGGCAGSVAAQRIGEGRDYPLA